jgi:hypothetical protein
MTTNQPLGTGFPAVVDGYNQWWNFGAGNSTNGTALPVNNGAWPNIVKFNITGTNIVTQGGVVATKLYYQYGGASNSVNAQFYFDTDFNPNNTNGVLITQILLTNTGVHAVNSDSIALTTTNVLPGVYAIYGRISDGVHTRYLYTPELVEVISRPQPPVVGIAQLNGTQFVITVTGTSNQAIVLQISTDLQNWLTLATNTLTTGGWRYTNDAAGNGNSQFYRAFFPH